jgi:uncharacterized protein DUF1553
VLLNDPIFVEAARVFAQHMLESGGKFDGQIDWAFTRALDRVPAKEERQVLSELYRKSLASFKDDAGGARRLLSVGESPLPPDADAARLAAMTVVARAILNLHETIARN